MKLTLELDDPIVLQLEEEALRRRQTISELVEAALRQFLRPPAPAKKLPPLQTFDSGGHLVDISNREELHDAMDGARSEGSDSP
ncbi:MAG TPA: ribbon-helix-helix protein, CopG family [Planctomycetota bacterium]|nr:ribbon-helix-helix protein, CopG family [Planctomycetota bacterium]